MRSVNRSGSRNEVATGEGVVTFHVDGPIAWVRMNRPEAMNALSDELLAGLNDALDKVRADRAIRAVVLSGVGRAFCVGADLNGLLDTEGSLDAEGLLAFVRRASATIERIPTLDTPVIAAINGLALAGGLELVLACDLVVATRSARLGDAHANYGLLPGGGGAARLARVVGPTVAKYLAFSGEFVPAEALVPHGLVNEVVDDGLLDARVGELATRLARKSAAGIAHMKQLINDAPDQPLTTALRAEHQALAVHVNGPDINEGLAAFREKREPRYPG